MFDNHYVFSNVVEYLDFNSKLSVLSINKYIYEKYFDTVAFVKILKRTKSRKKYCSYCGQKYSDYDHEEKCLCERRTPTYKGPRYIHCLTEILVSEEISYRFDNSFITTLKIVLTPKSINKKNLLLDFQENFICLMIKVDFQEILLYDKNSIHFMCKVREVNDHLVICFRFSINKYAYVPRSSLSDYRPSLYMKMKPDVKNYFSTISLYGDGENLPSANNQFYDILIRQPMRYEMKLTGFKKREEKNVSFFEVGECNMIQHLEDIYLQFDSNVFDNIEKIDLFFSNTQKKNYLNYHTFKISENFSKAVSNESLSKKIDPCEKFYNQHDWELSIHIRLPYTTILKLAIPPVFKMCFSKAFPTFFFEITSSVGDIKMPNFYYVVPNILRLVNDIVGLAYFNGPNTICQ